MEYFMAQAIKEAKLALAADEFPVGAVIVHQNQIIARAHNQVQTKKNPTFHAEILAINSALHALHRKYLIDCEMFITLEPCLMCFKAISLVKMRRIYISLMNSSDAYSIERIDPLAFDINHIPEIITGVSANTMTEIFNAHIKKLQR